MSSELTWNVEVGAEYTKKALLKVSLSELEEDRGLEENMRIFQRYATTWKAVMLIDEADIFLEARSSGGKEQAERNALVAGTELYHLVYQSSPID